MPNPSILEEARQELDTLSPDELRSRLAEVLAQRKEASEKRKAYNAQPKVRAARAATQAERTAGRLDPTSPHFDASYAKKFTERLEANLAKARAAGLDVG